jgi:hypothetical protein
MDNSLSAWLQLREPADTVARSGSLTRVIADTLAGREPLRVLDLATGTGANLRHLAPHLPSLQHWLAADRDPSLLALLPGLTASWGAARDYDVRPDAYGCVVVGDRLECDVETSQLNLGSLADIGIFRGRHLVTASALLDLASEHWLQELAACCRAADAAALFALTYNGRSSCSPAEPEDDVIRDLLNQHQRRDKGLGGPAAGPDAAECAVRCFTEAGYRVHTAASDWSLGPAEDELQRCLFDGWAEVAVEMGLDAALVDRWRDRRIEHLEAGRSHVVVGHLDIAAVPPPRAMTPPRAVAPLR